jgi:hypothetical protein
VCLYVTCDRARICHVWKLLSNLLSLLFHLFDLECNFFFFFEKGGSWIVNCAISTPVFIYIYSRHETGRVSLSFLIGSFQLYHAYFFNNITVCIYFTALSVFIIKIICGFDKLYH